MEERCDWGVSIQPPLPDDLSALAPPRRKKAPPPHTTPTPPQHTHTEPHAPIRKQRSAPAEERGGAKKAPLSETEPQCKGGVASLTVSRQHLQESLPKIPPLPSFKPRRSEPISLQGAVLDFQRFITEGPGRTVEVVRQFGRRGAGPEGDVTANGIQEEEPPEERILLHDEQPSSSSQRMRGRTVTSDPASYAPSSGSPSPSSSPSSSSSSEFDMEEEELPSQSLPERSARHAATARPIKSEPTPAAPALKHHHSQSRPSAARHPSQSPHPSRPPHPSARPSGSVAQRGGSSLGRARRHETLGEPPELQGEEEEEEGEGPDYWGRSYAQAWRQYYNSLPPPYRHAYSSAHAWMAAYRMSSVYMQEMMKP